MGLQTFSVDRINLNKLTEDSNPYENLKYTQEIPIYPALPGNPPSPNHVFSAQTLSFWCQEAQDKGNGGAETTGMTLDVVETGQQLRGGVVWGQISTAELWFGYNYPLVN